MPHEVVNVDWEGRPVGAFVPAPLAEIGPLGAAGQSVRSQQVSGLSGSIC